MKVAVTGGTGYVGGHVVEALVRREHEVRLLVRDPNQHGWLKDRPALQVVQGSLDDAAALQQLVAGVDAVVHLVGIIVETGRQTFQRVHVEGTENLLAAARGAGTPRFVHMSALGARADEAATPYHRTKAAAEEFVRQSGLPHVILRPSLIAGSGNDVMKMLVNMLRMSPLVPVIGNGLYQMQPVAVDDVADAIATAVENPAIAGTFDVAGPVTLTYHQILDELEEALGVQRRRVAVPVTMVRFAASAGMVLPNLNPITPDQLQMLLESSTTPSNALPTTFHITPRRFEEVAREICAPYAASPSPEPSQTASA
ncbi:MAG: NAD-dependent epimerase/dehydratase family protein [Gemmatimonadales bacterium]